MLGANPLPGKEEELNVTTAKILSTTTESVLIEEDSLIVKKNETFLNETKVEEFVCAFYNPDFIIYSSLGSFYIPCVIMVFLYIRIFSTLRARARVRKPKPTSLRANKKMYIGQENGAPLLTNGNNLNDQGTSTGNGEKSPNLSNQSDDHSKAKSNGEECTNRVVANPADADESLLQTSSRPTGNKADKARLVY